MTRREQETPASAARLSGILWDLFTGSSSYGDILRRGFHPGFGLGLAWNFALGAWRDPEPRRALERRPLGV
jgi:hypothetical protein